MKAYRQRWQLVNALEEQELRSASMKTKLEQLNALFSSVTQLGWQNALQAEEHEVRERWQKLRKAYHA
jgi:hypothetical protein